MVIPDLHFAKQFFITDSKLPNQTFTNWRAIPLLNGLTLHTHPTLNIEKINRGTSQYILLGHIIDPFNPAYSNQDVLNNIFTKDCNFSDIEKSIFSLGGRWILLLDIPKDTRIYHDAAGLKPVFYCTNNGSKFVASQPSLLSVLGATNEDPNKLELFSQHNNAQSWPINASPYHDVAQLIPNHYLDVIAMRSTRYWPHSKLEQQDTNTVATKMNQILKGTLQALILRGNCTMSLTGGYDSRLLLSCALEYKDKLSFFTVLSDFTPQYDIDIPKKLAKLYDLKHKFVLKNNNAQENDSIISVLLANVGNMFYDRSKENITAFAEATNNNTHLPGSVSEISRCYYYPYGIRHRKMNGKSLARIAGFKANPIAESAFEQWCSTVPKDMCYYILDLLYWEHRLGTWGACGLTFKEGLMDQTPPMNNRLFMSLGLSTPVKDRLAPYRLTQNIIALNDPKLLSLNFNNDSKTSYSYQFPLLRRVVKLLKNG
ncbi:hypothetical protein [Paraglaciecola sp.]|uniref:hypothetical protein n=1 Tax=Paraglaciecola sp. TaxID=1920173 RepID=UPI0030F3DFD9